jgi:protein involved in polysaccharide export with SLBB domain
LKEGDDLDLRFVYQPELNLGVRIRSDGKISLPLLGDVRAAGLTPSKLRDDLGTRYGKHIKHPDVAVLVGPSTAKKVFADEAYLMVTIQRLASQTVYVGGEVKSPKVVPYDGQITTWQAIMQAGSFTDEADLAHVVILRRGQYEQGAWIRTNLEMPLDGERFPNDLALRTGDVVIVPKSGIAKWDLWVKQYIRDALPVQTYLSIFLIPYQAKPQ